MTVPGTWKVNRYDPLGRLDRSIELPVSNPTCVAFGGDLLETLYVTSATFMVAAGAPKEPAARGRPSRRRCRRARLARNVFPDVTKTRR